MWPGCTEQRQVTWLTVQPAFVPSGHRSRALLSCLAVRETAHGGGISYVPGWAEMQDFVAIVARFLLTVALHNVNPRQEWSLPGRRHRGWHGRTTACSAGGPSGCGPYVGSKGDHRRGNATVGHCRQQQWAVQGRGSMQVAAQGWGSMQVAAQGRG